MAPAVAAIAGEAVALAGADLAVAVEEDLVDSVVAVRAAAELVAVGSGAPGVLARPWLLLAGETPVAPSVRRVRGTEWIQKSKN